MMRRTIQRSWAMPLAVASGLALTLAGAACSNKSGANGRRTADRDQPANNSIAGGAGEQHAAVTLTGCLQKGSGSRDYILAPANTATAGRVGSNGSAATGDVVGREQEAAAERSYRLSGDNDQLGGMVGKQVRVRGRITDRGDLNEARNGSADRDERGTSGSADRDRHDIDAGDLAKVEVDSIDKIADSCGTSPRGTGSTGTEGTSRDRSSRRSSGK